MVASLIKINVTSQEFWNIAQGQMEELHPCESGMQFPAAMLLYL